MTDLIKLATSELSRFLEARLPELSPQWWDKHVLDRLTFQQQRIATERGFKAPRQLDLAGLLRVLDQNWYELSVRANLPREGRTWVKELQTVRNKWAHLSTEAMPASEIYRDADTLGRLLEILGADKSSIEAIESMKATALEAISRSTPPQSPAPRPPGDQPGSSIVGEPSETKAPLFREGDLVSLRSNPSAVMPVLEIMRGGPEYRYRVFHNNAKATYYESQLGAVHSSTSEVQSLSADQLHAHLTSLQILSPSTATLFSLRSGRVQFVPYQYRPVLKLIRADRPRLLIADEVGVGKTIEAGLIIKELRARMDITSVLVICPKALISERKWAMEMLRFDEHFNALDGPLLRHCLQETHLEGEWPEQYGKALLPFSLFDSDLVLGRGGPTGSTKTPSLLKLDPPPKFDLVIVDEAHHIRNSDTFAHQGVRYFCDNAQAVVLMTATPVQLGSEDLYTLLNVLRPDLIIDRASFDQMAEPNRTINAAVQVCRAAGPGWQQDALRCLDEAADTEWGRLFVRESPAFQSIHDRLQEPSLDDTARVGMVRAIEELYTFSPLINRTRRRDIGEFTTRKPETVTIEFTPQQRHLHDGLLDVVARILAHRHGQQNVKFMMTTIRRQAASCLYGLAPMLSDILGGRLDRLEILEASDSDTEINLDFVAQIRGDIESLVDQARNLDPHDPKVAAFVRVLLEKSQRPNNKALLFSTFRHTLAYLDRHARDAGLRVGLIHGDIPDDDRAELRRRFKLAKEDGEAIDVLLSSEVGCEGLDFQFCDLLINYDLPWNPMRIEQRIGRIDRYGQQSETVAIVNFVTPGTVDADIYERCLWRIGVFEHSVGGNEEILGEITAELHDIAESFTLTETERSQRLQQMADNGIRQIREEQELETKQTELFGLNVPGQSWREDIKAAEAHWLSPEAIQQVVAAYLTQRLGGSTDLLLGEKAVKTLRLNQEARGALLEDYRRLPRSVETIPREWERWLKGSQPTLSVTFDQVAAAENPKVVHLSVAHPLVRQAAQALEIVDPKHFRFSTRAPDVAAGVHHFAIYRWSMQGIKLDESLVVVSDHAQLEEQLLTLLQGPLEGSSEALPDQALCDQLDARHYGLWAAAQANHIAANRQLADYRIQSLTASHRARCKSIDDQLSRATNDKIRLMKESERARANADFQRRMEELQKLAASGDIRAVPVLFGTVTVAGPE